MNAHADSEHGPIRCVLTFWRATDGRQYYRELAYEDALDRVAGVVASLANHGQGCAAAMEHGDAPCAEICQCKAEAEVILGELAS